MESLTDEERARRLRVATELLERQQTALVRGELATIAREGAVLACVLASVLEGLDSGPVDREMLLRFRRTLRENRLLLENGIAAVDHFMATLQQRPGQTGVLLSERA